MSHFTFYAEPIPVETRHGDVYVGVGKSDSGVESVCIVGPGDECTDIHLSRHQALLLAAAVRDAHMVLADRETARYRKELKL